MNTEPIVFQVVGYSNSGKTTLIKKIISNLKNIGLDVATIKHHGHATDLQPIKEDKDSHIHRQAGAVGSFVVSDHQFQWDMSPQMTLDLEDVLHFYQRFSLDAIIVEGYKKKSYSKLLLLKSSEDRHLINECENIEIIVCWDEIESKLLKESLKMPVFHLNEEKNYLKWLVERLCRGETL
ncbi:molybdopterin-guanine dinucleotide biosynthesis protein B [Evansella cellulosilytica]|uniref:Molybdopterin-guanine dinucleotide biosynthesis protein B n=1 Tax=Evansella cellulosilytica (strain ATCC 21833 / DSM 2522 / FERM P-1141 / JCM 9156 / N-4) TaxID=649639 RepID=E6TXY0_EVAC2|nr:molybdopterin-guanine dinucleotide biosynthesis protein B [Evansella cellulosilytica]ADU31193.1 molybdopterin-guanine dinucleotide biosynthesis protein B [Evansella cellulosilytica DSM 2522]